MIIIGLTGSIGMGKSTTAQMFRDAGIPVHDSDAAVHRLYAGEAAPLIEAAFPDTVENGVVNRDKLAAQVLGKPDEMKRLEAIIHPLVGAASQQFLDENARKNTPIVVLDIPLLFETGRDKSVDRIVVVTATPEIQRDRVLARPGMTEDRFEAIVARQVDDAQKRARADFIIDTGLGLEAARNAVQDIIRTIG